MRVGRRLLPSVGKGLLPPNLCTLGVSTADALAPKSESIDAYLHFVYVHIAKPLAEQTVDLDSDPYLSDMYVSASKVLQGQLGSLRHLSTVAGVQEALFLDSDPVALAAADAEEGDQSNAYLVVLMLDSSSKV